MLSVLVGILAIFVHSRSDADELIIDSLKKQQNMIDSGSGSIWYLSGASKNPKAGSIFRLSRILMRFVRHHSPIV